MVRKIQKVYSPDGRRYVPYSMQYHLPQEEEARDERKLFSSFCLPAPSDMAILGAWDLAAAKDMEASIGRPRPGADAQDELSQSGLRFIKEDTLPSAWFLDLIDILSTIQEETLSITIQLCFYCQKYSLYQSYQWHRLAWLGWMVMDSGCPLLFRMNSIFTRLKEWMDSSFPLVSLKPEKDVIMRMSLSPLCGHKECSQIVNMGTDISTDYSRVLRACGH